MAETENVKYNSSGKKLHTFISLIVNNFTKKKLKKNNGLIDKKLTINTF